jgi:N-acetylglucosaminyldiphosphoundecaprenol N-acetyl-beta-D-mannosaminyltransferase
MAGLGPSRQVLGIPVSLLDTEATMAALQECLARGPRGWVCTVDAAGLVMSMSDEGLADVYRGALLATPDSHGVVWALRQKGEEVSGRVSGIELADRLCALSSRRGYGIYLLGAAPGVADEAAERLRLRHPGCRIVGTHNGFFPPEDDPLVAEEVAKAKPDILLVAMGIPRQEKFIAAHLAATGASIGMGVGGSFDVMSGRVRRAPRWVQRLRAEWVWRLLHDPRKIAKVKLLPKFVFAVLREGR